LVTNGILKRVGLTLAAFRVSEWLRAADLRVRRKNTRVRESSADGIPLPPERLVVVVAGSPDLAWFVEGGRLAAESIRAAAARHDAPLEGMQAVLDFGCGCGRVLRHLPATGPRLHGCDYNHELIAWCRSNLPAGDYRVNELVPPLHWPDASFDLVWALSVFTHLPEELQRRWMTDLQRVLKPGGMLMVTTQGAHYVGQLTPDERVRYERGDLIVRYSEAPGTNLCTAFHPEAYVRGAFTDGFELAEFVPGGAIGNPFQDLIVLRAPDG
jgi:SAM-dependent methyltransferase